MTFWLPSISLDPLQALSVGSQCDSTLTGLFVFASEGHNSTRRQWLVTPELTCILDV